MPDIPTNIADIDNQIAVAKGKPSPIDRAGSRLLRCCKR